MKIEIVERLSKEGLTHIKIQCANGDTIRLEVEEFNNVGSTENRISVTCVDTYPSIMPKEANKIIINFLP